MKLLRALHIQRRLCTHIDIHICTFFLQIQGRLHKAPYRGGFVKHLGVCAYEGGFVHTYKHLSFFLTYTGSASQRLHTEGICKAPMQIGLSTEGPCEAPKQRGICEVHRSFAHTEGLHKASIQRGLLYLHTHI